MKRFTTSVIVLSACASFSVARGSNAQPLSPPPAPTPPAAPTVEKVPADAPAAANQIAVKEASKASQAARDAAESAKAAADEVANAKSGKLISSGITAGIAPVAQIALGNAITTTALGSMPYVMAHPVYWQSTHALNTYCASNWALGGDEHAASLAAYAIAKKKGERSFEALVNALRPYGAGDASIDDNLKEYARTQFVSSADDQAAIGKSIVDRTLTWLRVKTQGSADTEWVAAERASIIELIATLSWNPVWSGKCVTRKFGIWIGIPLKYNTTTELGIGVGTDARGKRDVQPTIAVGLGFSPNAYLSVLVGVSFNSIARAANPLVGAPGGDVSAVTLVAGVGGNLDLLTLLKP